MTPQEMDTLTTDFIRKFFPDAYGEVADALNDMDMPQLLEEVSEDIERIYKKFRSLNPAAERAAVRDWLSDRGYSIAADAGIEDYV